MNVLVHAWHARSPRNDQAVRWLESAVGDARTAVLLDPLVVAGVVRVLTNRRIPTMGHPVDEVLRRVDDLVAAPGVRPAAPGHRHWTIFSGLCREVDGHGNLVPDLHLAATALERGATLVSEDAVFARVPGLAWQRLD